MNADLKMNCNYVIINNEERERERQRETERDREREKEKRDEDTGTEREGTAIILLIYPSRPCLYQVCIFVVTFSKFVQVDTFYGRFVLVSL